VRPLLGAAYAPAVPDGGTTLATLDADDRRRLLEVAARRTFRRGEVVFHEGDTGDALFLIERGHVAIRITTPLGDVATLVVLGPDETFGEGALLAPDSNRSGTAVALDGVVARVVRRAEFEALRAERPAINAFLVDVLAARVRRTSAHLVEALYVPAETRVLRRLALLAELYDTSGRSVVIPLTQDDIATMAGTTRPTTNRVLKAVEEDGVIVLARGRVEVVDRELLARRAR
jgi:CRP/FNR family transcriptional regulator, cyclic AMP receptor protein